MHPLLFQWGPFTFYSYGLMIAVGFLLAAGLSVRRASVLGLDPGKIQSLGMVVLAAGLAGGRLAYVLLNWDLYRASPLEILRLDHGGLVFYGGLAAGLLAGGIAIRRAGLPLWKTVDLLIPPLVLAHAVGRVGCFLNGCCYGKPSSLPWSVRFPLDGVARHPVQLYESAFLFLLFLHLSTLRSFKAGDGQFQPGPVLLRYGLLYGAWRFLIEFFRGDNPAAAAGLTVFQWASMAMIFFTVLCLVRVAHPSTRRSP